MKIKPYFHPLIFALYPILSLYIRNISQLDFSDIAATLLAAFIFLGVVWIVVYLCAKKNTHKAALLTSIFFILFFSFGHVVNWLILATFRYQSFKWLEKYLDSGSVIVLLLVIWVVLFALLWFLLNKSKLNLKNITAFMNIMAVVISVFMIFEIARSARGMEKETHHTTFAAEWNQRLEKEFSGAPPQASQQAMPDIYYIILDGYTRQDILQSIYQYDNSEFLQFLRNKGFYIAEKSHTNYPHTIQSLTSSLNFMYLDEIAQTYADYYANLTPLRILLDNNRLFFFLRQQGYSIRTLPTGTVYVESLHADVIDIPPDALNSFTSQILALTPISQFSNLIGIKDDADRFRERILYAFDHIQKPTAETRPTFTFVHILSPHPPFLFNAEGGPIDRFGVVSLLDADLYVGGRRSYQDGYRSQVIAINRMAAKTIETILGNASRPTIIILQGDHGPGSLLSWKTWWESYLPERMLILNAYYFWDGDYSRLYPDITPVNTFRILLNQYFGMQYDLLEDRGYFSSLSNFYLMEDITDTLDQYERGLLPPPTP